MEGGRATSREARYGRLYREHHEAVTGYVRRRAPATDAEEAVAETFLVAWRRLDVVPEGNTRAWLYGVARRVLAGQRRAHARRDRLILRLSAGGAHATIGDDQAGALGDAVFEALTRLRREDQVLLRLALIEGVPARELAPLAERGRAAAAPCEASPGRDVRDGRAGAGDSLGLVIRRKLLLFLTSSQGQSCPWRWRGATRAFE